MFRIFKKIDAYPEDILNTIPNAFLFQIWISDEFLIFVIFQIEFQ